MRDRDLETVGTKLNQTRMLGFVAAALTATAGVLELVVGSNSWTGDKSQPTTLGILTIVLAAIMCAAAVMSRRSQWSGHSLAAAAGIAVPAVVSFTTAGRLAIPGAVLGLLAAGFAVAAAQQRGSVRDAIDHAWPTAHIVVLAVIYLAFGAVAGPVGILGVAGAAAIVAALAFQRRSKPLAAGLLIVGVIPFAVAVWWSVVIPLTAILLLAIALPQLLSSRQPASIVHPRT